MRILTRSEAAAAAGAPAEQPQMSIRRAGYATAQFCAAHFKFASVCMVCGTGRKGSAGLVAAEALGRLAQSVAVIILAAGPDELAPDIAACLPTSIRPIWIADAADMDSELARQALAADLVVDAIIGTGFKPPLRPLAAKAIAAINDAAGTVVSVDIPSGVDSDRRTAVEAGSACMVFAHAIVALIAPKPAHVFAELCSGPIAVSEIGVQPALTGHATGLAVTTGQEVSIAFPRRRKDAGKEHFGRVLVVAGSRGEAGAAALAGLAAMSAGAGHVTVACPESIASTVAGLGAVLSTHGLPESAAGTVATTASSHIGELIADQDAVVVGPGLSRNAETAAFIRRLARACTVPLILDTDGLSAFAGHLHDLRRGDGAPRFRVLTLPAAEAQRLMGGTGGVAGIDRPALARRVADETGACAVLTGWRTVIAGASGETWINMTGGPALAKAGAGSILCGMLGAALARQADEPGETAGAAQPLGPPLHQTLGRDVGVAAAVYLHGFAGDIARDALHENAVLATDLLEALPEAFRDCDRQAERGLFYLHK